MEKPARIYVAGHKGLVGSAIVRRLDFDGWANLILRDRAELDLTRQAEVERFFAAEQPEYVFLAAAKVGGIWANQTEPAEFITTNLQIETNVIDAAYRHGVKKLVFLGSSCIYPKLTQQPIKEEELLAGPLEPTNQWYAVAKIAGLKMCQAYRSQYGFSATSLMPTNLYGPNDHFDLATSHVLPALMRKFHEAKLSGAEEVVLWGSGRPLREFLHVDDLARACVFLAQQYDDSDPINVGSGDEVSIAELADIMQRVVGCSARIVFDNSKPDGTPRKLLDSSRLRSLGWRPEIPLAEGIRQTYDWYCKTHA